jgi:threonine dehydrogenase-like Zn-dependent dehydrogenase
VDAPELLADCLDAALAAHWGPDDLQARVELAGRLDEVAAHVLDPAADDVGERIKELTGGRGADVCIEISGSYRALHEAVRGCAAGGRVVAAGFYQGGAANLRLGEEFHHNRLSLIASVGAWGAPDRHAPLWDRRRVLDTATRLLYTDRVSVEGMLDRTFRFDEALTAYRRLDEHPQDAVKVALVYGEGPE